MIFAHPQTLRVDFFYVCKKGKQFVYTSLCRANAIQVYDDYRGAIKGEAPREAGRPEPEAERGVTGVTWRNVGLNKQNAVQELLEQ